MAERIQWCFYHHAPAQSTADHEVGISCNIKDGWVVMDDEVRHHWCSKDQEIWDSILIWEVPSPSAVFDSLITESGHGPRNTADSDG